MKIKFSNVLLLLALLIEALIAAKEITKLDSSSNNTMNNGDFFYGKTELVEFKFGLDEIGLYLTYSKLSHQEFRYLSPIGRNEDTNTLSRNIKYGILGDDAVFRVYNTDGKEKYKLGEESSVRGQSTMTFESTDAYRNTDEYADLNVPLTYEKFYYPPRKTDTIEPVPFINPMQWIKWDGSVPEDAVSIKNSNGKTFIVGRTSYKQGIYCGYVDVNSKQLIISYGDRELIYDDNFEILTGSSNHFDWKKINMDNISEYADQIVIGGNESNGVKLGVAKCKYNDNYYYGKVNLDQLHHSNFGINNKEVECLDFEVLIYKKVPAESIIRNMQWIKWDGTVPDDAISIENPDGKTFLVGRIKYFVGYKCGTVDLSTKQLNIPGGRASFGYKDNFEILVGPSDHFYWKKMSKNTLLKKGHHIVVAEKDEDGFDIGIAKCKYDDSYFFGELNEYNSFEYYSYNYEVLIYSDEPIKNMEWIKWDGTIPEYAVSMKNSDGKTLVVGRTKYRSGIHCGYVDLDSKKLIISYGGKELIYDDDFEILTGSSNHFEWKKINMDNISEYANQIVIGGNESNGVKLGVAKCKYNDNYYFGKVNLDHLHHGNFGINSKEVECLDFEVLIYKDGQAKTEAEPVSSVQSIQWIKWNNKIPNGAIFIKDNPNGKIFIIGRISYNNSIQCGYIDVTTSDVVLFITFAGQLRRYTHNFEVLTAPSGYLSWKQINRNNISDYNIVTGGYDIVGHKLGIAKCEYENNYYFGKINLSEFYHAYFAYNDSEYKSYNYKILAIIEISIELSVDSDDNRCTKSINVNWEHWKTVESKTNALLLFLNWICSNIGVEEIDSLQSLCLRHYFYEWENFLGEQTPKKFTQGSIVPYIVGLAEYLANTLGLAKKHFHYQECRRSIDRQRNNADRSHVIIFIYNTCTNSTVPNKEPII
ncbi:hypothetical protein H8356DRAFT_1342615 [Neocallimastix lanati (nom. inval.)]|nr:hypothetical protein H8356DRAFT_1342615 [Neocallimastix sp. JGI-2020a]